MPKAYDDLVDRLKQHPEIRNPYAMAHAIQAHRKRAKAARAIHRKEQEEKAQQG